MLERPFGRRVRVVDRGGIAVLGCEAIVDRQDDAPRRVRQRTTEVFGDRKTTDDPAAAVEVHQEWQRAADRSVGARGHVLIHADRADHLRDLLERHDRVHRRAAAALARLLHGQLIDAARIGGGRCREELRDDGVHWHQRVRAPGPRTTRPGRASVCSPSSSTGVPFTTTCRTPVA